MSCTQYDRIQKSGSDYPPIKCELSSLTDSEFLGISTITATITDSAGDVAYTGLLTNFDASFKTALIVFPIGTELPAGLLDLELMIVYSSGYTEILPSCGKKRIMIL